ncbi:hypothetical protein RHIZ404_190194 [Rhizobium sp. EC-SD404]|nr:hypothetical protein RHIZ404_190194 [Rhizobium sp. EC-SD404]
MAFPAIQRKGTLDHTIRARLTGTTGRRDGSRVMGLFHLSGRPVQRAAERTTKCRGLTGHRVRLSMGVQLTGHNRPRRANSCENRSGPALLPEVPPSSRRRIWHLRQRQFRFPSDGRCRRSTSSVEQRS